MQHRRKNTGNVVCGVWMDTFFSEGEKKKFLYNFCTNNQMYHFFLKKMLIIFFFHES